MAAGVSEWSPPSNPIEVGISIDAPAKGATNVRALHVALPVVSIRAPVKGATSNGLPRRTPMMFQSALP